ncbi:hypothetical protein AYI70_g570 [Smittium culicis]|uniref:Uncharacterized protein n=1 Tax=Smittium culicis TaxID=133412 RepID=A0A1R1YG60_9FUNG|nr:hypothetical protein AYI70_g570 [Smittium culicis]
MNGKSRKSVLDSIVSKLLQASPSADKNLNGAQDEKLVCGGTSTNFDRDISRLIEAEAIEEYAQYEKYGFSTYKTIPE